MKALCRRILGAVKIKISLNRCYVWPHLHSYTAEKQYVFTYSVVSAGTIEKWIPLLDSDRRRWYKVVNVCVVGGWGANEWHCLKTVILLLYFYLSVSDTFGSLQHWLVSARRGSWWQDLVRGWSTNQIPCAASLQGSQALFIYFWNLWDHCRI